MVAKVFLGIVNEDFVSIAYIIFRKGIGMEKLSTQLHIEGQRRK